MKKFIYIVLLGFIVGSCGGDDGDDPQPIAPPENRAPSNPTLIEPTNGKLCINNTVSFQWNSSTDPEGDAISYQIEVAQDNQFNQIAHTLSGSVTSQSISLVKGQAYYWRVKAIDSENLSSSYSATFNFYTEGDGVSNHLPFSPELIKPEINEIVQTTTTILEWNANDVDTNDTLLFDVYFGASNPPTAKVAENQNTKTLEVDLNSSTNYYWKIVVKDDKGGETIGQTWNFKTD